MKKKKKVKRQRDFLMLMQTMWNICMKGYKRLPLNLFESRIKLNEVIFDCYFHQKMDCHKVVSWQIRLQELVRVVVKCCLNHLRKKYGVLNINRGAGKNA